MVMEVENGWDPQRLVKPYNKGLFSTSVIVGGRVMIDTCTLPPETNVAPENRPLEKEIPIGNHHFQVLG